MKELQWGQQIDFLWRSGPRLGNNAKSRNQKKSNGKQLKLKVTEGQRRPETERGWERSRSDLTAEKWTQDRLFLVTERNLIVSPGDGGTDTQDRIALINVMCKSIFSRKRSALWIFFFLFYPFLPFPPSLFFSTWIRASYQYHIP